MANGTLVCRGGQDAPERPYLAPPNKETTRKGGFLFLAQDGLFLAQDG